VTRRFYFDTTRPVVDLDPFDVQEMTDVGGALPECSRPFDPLGKAANDWTKDKKTIVSGAEFRVLAWDLANEAADIHTEFSGIDGGTVVLYIQPDADKGLLTSSDPKHDPNSICDDLDTTATPIGMNAVGPNGSADYEPTTPIDGVCISGNQNKPPDPICKSLPDLTRVIQHDQSGGAAEAVIFAVNSPDQGACSNSDLELPSLLGVTKNGWLCLAARATDKAGNVGVSAPMRLCLSNPGLGAAPECATGSFQPPPCTRNCKAPPHFAQTLIAKPL
jgi:hypothetical protein